ncbi:hypothetical protein V1511DRAFT_485761 [Dipodascopsis uninucleata]
MDLSSPSKALLGLLQRKSSQKSTLPMINDPAIATFGPASTEASDITGATSSKSTVATSSAARVVNADTSLRSSTSRSSSDSESQLKALLKGGTAESSTPKSPTDTISSKKSIHKSKFTYVNPFDDLEARSPMRSASSATPSPSVSGSKINSLLDSAAEKLIQKNNYTAENISDSVQTVAPEKSLERNAATSSGPDSTNILPSGNSIQFDSATSLCLSEFSFAGGIDSEKCEPIANFVRESTQFDRNILAVNDDFIAYPVATGIRVLSQLNGSYSVLIGHDDHQIINLSFSSYHSSAGTSLLVSTTVNNEIIVWELLTKNFLATPRQSHYRKLLRIEKLPANSEHVPKSRVHWPSISDCVAVAISKNIYLFPLNPENFLEIRRSKLSETVGHKAIIIETDSGAKDFVFSLDGSIIAGVNKFGSVTFWDVSKLPQLKNGTEQPTIKSALWTIQPHGDTRYTSIQFIDSPQTIKDKKPLRYLLLGFNQNHSFHVYDLVSRKIVQEFSLPPPLDSSMNGLAVSYGTGLVVVSDRVRNAFIFLHLSFPQYQEDYAGSQAEMIRTLGNSSDMTEASRAGFDYMVVYSFLEDHQILSFTLLEVTGDDNSLLDLYICHNKGATIFAVHPDTIAFNRWNMALPLTDVKVTPFKECDGYGNAQESVDSSANTSGLGADIHKSSPVRKHSIIPLGAMKAKMANAKATVRSPAMITAGPGIATSKRILSRADTSTPEPKVDSLSKEIDELKESKTDAFKPPAETTINGGSLIDVVNERFTENTDASKVSKKKKKKEIPSNESASISSLSEHFKKSTEETKDPTIDEKKVDLDSNSKKEKPRKILIKTDSVKASNEVANGSSTSGPLNLVKDVTDSLMSAVTTAVDQSVQAVLKSGIAEDIDRMKLSRAIASNVRQDLSESIEQTISSTLERMVQPVIEKSIAAAMSDINSKLDVALENLAELKKREQRFEILTDALKRMM